MSKYVIKKESVVTLEYDGDFFILDALGSYTYSQTYVRNSNSRKTLHKKVSTPLTIVSGKNPGTSSMQVNSTDSYIESVLLTLVGLSNDRKAWWLPDELPIEPTYFNLYIVNQGSTVKLENCAVSSLDLSLNKQSTLSFSIGMEFSNIVLDSEDVQSSTYQGNAHPETSELSVEVESIDLYSSVWLPSLRSVSFSLQQDFSWRNDNSIHTLHKMYVPTKAIVSDFLVNTIIAVYAKTDKVLPEITTHADITIKYGSILTIIISNATITKRYEVSEVLGLQYDLSLQENSSVAVEYGAQ
jgi:hypothetical protein